MKKRLFSLALCLALVFSIFAAVNVTASAETYNGFEYYVWGDSAEITAYNGTDKKITFPSKFNGKTVTEIGFNAFA